MAEGKRTGSSPDLPPLPAADADASSPLAGREAELAELRERLETLAQAKAELLARLSRELREPLAQLLAPLNDLLDSPATALAPSSRPVLDAARRNAAGLLDRVNQALAPSIAAAAGKAPADNGQANTLPAREVDRARIEAARSAAAGPGRRGRVVVADDNAEMRTYLGHLLGTAGYEVETVADGLAALAACQSRPPDAVLSDVMMPGLDGLELIVRLRASENTALIPVLLLSARSEEDARIAGLTAGADDYLAKPFGRRELVARVDGAVRLARLRREAAQREQADFAALFAMAPDGVIVVDRNGRILKANERAHEMFGYAAAEFAGQPLAAMLPEDLRADHGGRCEAQAPLAPPLRANRELRGRRRDGSEFFAEIEVGPLRFKDQDCTIVTVRDITERKRFEARLVEIEKLESVGQLTGGLAHDFNNLLAIILGNLDRLKPGLSDDKNRHYHDLAWHAGERASRITKSLLAVARKQTLEPRQVNVIDTLTNMMPLIRQAVGNDIRVSESRASNCAAGAFASIDPAGLSNAILNLAINSRDAMPAGGAIRISIESRQIGPGDDDAPPDLAPGRYIAMSVIDNGVGMSAEVAARAFEPFFTTKERGQGTGLGLAIVYGFARQSGGTATIVSEPGAGTTVALYLPALNVSALAPVATAEPVAAPSASNGERILVVDDEEMLLEVTHEWLSRLGYRVTKSASPTEALELLHSEKFDLLLTDFTMPGLNGIKLAEQAVGMQPGIKIALVSGFAADMLHTGWPILEKPFSRAELADSVRNALAGPVADLSMAPAPPVAEIEPEAASGWRARISRFLAGPGDEH